MTVTVLLSPGGSPGVTTAALALTLAWPRPAVMAECDPAGGAVLAGLWQGRYGADRAGMLAFAVDAQRGPRDAAARLLEAALPLEPSGRSSRWVLAAPPGPQAGRQIAVTWPVLAPALAAAGPDVICDAGRWDADPVSGPLLAAADRVLVLCHPGVRPCAAARPRLEALARIRQPDGLLLAGRGRYGAGAARAVAGALGAEVRAVLPHDPRAAAVLSDGRDPGRGFGRSPLMRAASRLAVQLSVPAGLPAGAAGAAR